MAEHSAAVGIETIDFGKGAEEYKRIYRNASVAIAEGAVELVSFETVPRILLRASKDFIRNTPFLLKPARAATRLWRTVLRQPAVRCFCIALTLYVKLGMFWQECTQLEFIREVTPFA
jgi:CelD/BcsL family acetyltransferase involved in cellulose biosynthesis